MAATSPRRRPARRALAQKRSKEAASTAATKILQAALREDCTPQELSDMACGDPAFAGRVLAWINSPAFKLKRHVADVRQATSMLGIRGLRNIALGMVLTDQVPAGPKAAVLLGNGLRRALVAHAIAEQVDRAHADVAFTVGLFLEAGLLNLAAESVDAAFEIASGPAAHRLVRERALGRRAHPEVGAEIAHGYRFNDEMVHAIAHHHDPTPPKAALSRIAWAAEHVSAVFEGGVASQVHGQAEAAAAAVGLEQGVFQDLVEMTPMMVRAGAEIFERDVGEQLTWQEMLQSANEQLMRLNVQYEQTVRTLETLIQEKEALAEELRIANKKLVELASHDPLTGLPNRRAMQAALEREMARSLRTGKPLAVAMMDLDRFKAVNDNYGHDVGDEVLRVVSAAVQSTLRATDIFARFGGEEFVIVMPESDCEQATVALERARQAVERTPIVAGGSTIGVTSSFGLSCSPVPPHTEDIQALLKRADEAVYAAKRAGRNRVVAVRG